MDEFIAVDEAPRGGLEGLGRLPAIDERSHYSRYAMAAPQTTLAFRNWLSPRWQEWPRVLDQGGTSECVAYSATKFLLTHPIVNRPQESCNSFYKRCQQIDEWPGEDYDGTSVNASMKILKQDGLISGYTWAFEMEPVRRHVLEIGPVCVGTDWTIDMFTPDRWGYIWPTGAAAGGHAYLIIGASNRRNNPDGSKGAFRIINSWGPKWGPHNGRAWISYGVMEKLIRGLGKWPGEAAAPVEVQLPR